MKVCDVLDLIGNTPVVKLRKIVPKDGAQIYAKLEWYNIGGSVKDRAALYMFEAAESSGLLTKDKTIIEATSGNTGIALAMIGAVKGYKVTIVMSESASVERRRIVKAYGADLILTPADKGTAGAIEYKERLVRENPNHYISLDQFSNPANVLAHYMGTGREILDQMDGKVDMVVMSVGTGGTSNGVARRLRDYLENVRIVGVTPAKGVRIEGIRNPKEPNPSKLVNLSILDELVEITDEKKSQCFETGRRCAREEGLLIGMSSSCALHVALEKSILLGPDKRILVIFPDNGYKYLSTDLFRQ
ncbi:MAG TPA: cysteine synthase family protein [Thermoplasmataceae archaeon]|nr:cysteine synthase family protein [Thermoplasmatales archaeon AK]HLH86777.1 cysteine synthase family protein [Thermoplasmataceae archaeon]